MEMYIINDLKLSVQICGANILFHNEPISFIGVAGALRTKGTFCEASSFIRNQRTTGNFCDLISYEERKKEGPLVNMVGPRLMTCT